ncbi:MAG: hypothetical protein WAW37_08005 [Syntrophobacteraceae bacterium]
MRVHAETSQKIPVPVNNKPFRNGTRDLVELAVRGLEDMFDEGEQLFCHRSKLDGDKLENEGHSLRYTLITLLGLFRFEQKGGKSPFAIESLIDSLIKRIDRIDSLGDLGLMLWLCGLAAPDRIKDIRAAVPLESAIDRYKDGTQRLTVELSWFLTGLVYAAASSAQTSSETSRVAFTVFEILQKNRGGEGIFGHQSPGGITGILRGRIGCFADQVYPIYVLSKYAEIFDNKDAAALAERCADAICAHQGELGQWWWHYDAVSGKIRGRYPVFSVHQHAMAPMALLAAGQLTGRDYSDPIYKGVEWIRGNNELGLNLIDSSRNRIWRSFYESRSKILFELAYSAVLPLRENENSRKKLMARLECRPYCLGWLLYAFA